MEPEIHKVLLLDDDPNLRGVLSDILKMEGFEPIPVKTGAAAFARIEQEEIGVALIDIKLEDMSGLEVLRGIKARLPETECIMLTGNASQVTAIEAVNLGAYSYFQKPYNVDQLLVAIRRASEKHAAGHALQESEARFRSMIENSSDLICILNPDATLRYASPSIERLLGYTKDDIVIGIGLQDYIHPDDISDFIEVFRAHIRNSDSSPVPMRLRMLHKNGSWLTLEGTGSNLLGNPAIGGIIINARDITARIRAEQALIESQQTYQMLVEQIPSVIYRDALDKKATTLFISPQIKDLSGYPSEEWVADPDLWLKILHPDDRTRVMEENERHLTTGEQFISDYRLIARDGRIVWVRDEAVTICDSQGNPLYDQGVFTDITESKRAQEAVRLAEENYRTIFDKASVGIFQSTPEGRFVKVNPTMARIYGYDSPEEMMASIQNISHDIYKNPSDLKKFQRLLKERGEVQELLGLNYRKDGSLIWTMTNARVVKDGNGKILYYEGFITDITGRKQTEESLRKSESSLQSVLQSTADGILAVGSENEVLYANQRFSEMWHIPLEVMTSRDDTVLLKYVLDQLHDPQKFLKKVQELYKSKKESFDTLHFKDGRIFERLSRPLLHGVKATGRVWSFRDITSRKQAEEALRESEERYRQLVERTPMGALIHVDGQIVFANSASAKILGSAVSEDLIGKRLLDFVHPDYQRIVKDRVKQLTEKKIEVPLIEEKLVRMDGTMIDAEVTAIPFQYKNRDAVQVVFSDITERRRAEQRLSKLNDCFLNFGSDPIANINLLVKFTGEMFGATCAFYNQLQGNLLCSVGAWNTPQDYKFNDLAEGHICTEIIKSKGDEIVIIRNLQDSSYAKTDPNVRYYHLQTYIGKPVKFEKSNVGVLCVVFQSDIIPGEDDKRLLGIIASAMGVEEDRRHADKIMRESEERYRMLAENMSDTVWLMDMNLRTTYISPSVTRLRGYTLDEINSIPFDQQMTPDSVRRVLQLFAEAQTPENLAQRDKAISQNIELEVYKKDGTKFWSENTFTLIRDSQGAPLAILGSGRDISERKEAESALQDSEKYFRLLIENNTDAVVLVDPLGLILYESPAYSRMMGWAAESRLGKSGLEHVHPEDRDIVARLLNELTRHPGEIRQVTFRNQHKDGSWRWIEATATNLLGESAVHGLVVNMHDITERKQAEEVLRLRESYLSAILENQPGLVWLKDENSRFLTVNQAFAVSCGKKSPSELAGRTDFDIWPKKLAKKYRADDAKIINLKAPIVVEEPIVDRGKTTWFETFKTPILDDKGAVIGTTGYSRDITDRKHAEDEIRHRVADLEVLYENGLSINVLLEPRKIAQKMIEVLSQKLDWHHTTIRLYHPETRRIELLALNKPGWTLDQILAEIDRLNKRSIHSTEGMSGWVIKHGKTIRSGDVRADKRYISTFPDIRSGLYVPLMIGERSIGAIAVESRQVNRFSEEDERLLQTLAAQSAIAFENARLYQDALSASTRKAALHQGGLDIVRAGQDMEALCLALHHAARQVMPAEGFTVCLLTADGLEADAPYLFDRGVRYPNTRLLANVGITGRVIKSKKSLRIKDLQKTRRVKPIEIEGAEPTRAVLSVPLLAQEKIIGVISAQSSESDVYTAEDQVFMETLASEAAVAFENARLFEEGRRRLAELESLSQVSTSLTSAIDLQPLLEKILAGARNAIPAAEKGTILLIEPDGELHLHAMSGYTDPRLIGLVLPDQNGYAVRVARERTPIKIDDAHAEYEIPYKGSVEEIDAVQSGISAPLIVKGKVIGVISLDNASRKAAFTESDLRLLVTFASSAAVAIENARLFIETQQRLHRLTALHSIDAAIGASVDTHVTLSIVLEHVIAELKADAAAVLLFNPLTRTLEYAAGRGFRVHSIEGLRLRLGEGLAGQSALQRRAISIDNLQHIDEVQQVLDNSVSRSGSLSQQILEGENFVAYHAIPLIAKGQIQGVLEIFQRTPMQVDQEWITFFEMLAGQTAIAVDNGRLFENLQKSNLELTLAYDATIQGWSQALELRDEETEGHTRRVTDLTLRLIQFMGVEEVETEHARRGSLLHDIGKIAVPDSILLKAGPLDEREWSVMRQHPQYAFNLLNPITYLRPAIHIPYCHHEKWDGSGYPRGLIGEDIPMVARIFAIVDVYDALTSNRPYRLAWTRDKALEYISEQSGRHFDPRVVKAFMEIMSGER